MVAPIADCRLALRTLLAPFGSAALTNGGPLGAVRPCGTPSLRDPEGLAYRNARRPRNPANPRHHSASRSLFGDLPAG